MSVLAADIGNAHTTLALLDEGEVIARWRVSTDERRTSDEWAVVVRGLLAEQPEEPVGVAVCSTVPAVLHEWREMLATHFPGLGAVVVEPGVRTGVAVRTDNPREVGADRIVNALAAKERYGGPAIVVDFGATATTFDVLDGQDRYVGGAIAPGMDLALEALGRRGAQLRKVELLRPRSVIATNTVEALQSGLLFGVAAQVDGLVDRMVAELGADPDEVEVVATGHLAPLVVGECARLTQHDPDLTLRGLASVFERNEPGIA